MNDHFVPSDIAFSLELFPPKTEKGLDRLLETVDVYSSLDPAALTVTFGATGTEETVHSVRHVVSCVKARARAPVSAHITCANRTRRDVDEMVDFFWDDGIRHIVALRGDMRGQGAPYQPYPEGYETTYEFISSIKTRHPDMSVYVAGYPETHPESSSQTFDLDHLKRKVDAGADGVLTQFFFDPEVFLNWRDRVEKRGITVPLVPGLLPVLNFEKTCDLAARCNAHVPYFLHAIFEGVDADSIDHKLLAMEVMTHQITRLIDHGVSRFHFYTMNETMLTSHLCRWMRAGF
ncbi:MAG: methylenetetrahydrofolate reductase [Bdellovibrionales bacterium]